ncbi:DEAD-box ATP-dependent RNA helicase 22 [Acropora cervicornis]|uniref:RNA helicase n=1 Tax=Acropora cervicornis TaxID=6130 RepID=A0AAD9Q5H9_ACRCE|nr:DEAD-box ATP-dependent RNA helicase 22 [Acropora cervicornis]
MAVVSLFCRTFSNRAICFKKVKRRMFHTFGLKDILIKRLKDINISNPTPIQEKALRPVLEGNDTIINAETGSGKTLCYLLPIINKLLSSENILSRPPYAVVLLPSIELCNQVASVFQSLTDHTMAPCLVHKESKLFVNCKYPIIVATPDSLFNYGLSSLSNVQVVVTDEADFLITGGGDVVWEILSFFKGVDSLKTKRRQRRLARRQKVSREPNAVQGSIESFDPKTQKEKKLASATPDCHNELLNAPISAPKRQFVFVAATLPHHGPKAAFNVLKEWIPEAQLVSTDLAHHPVPTVGISYMRVHEANKLPTLLLCLNVLAGVIKNPLKNYGMKISMDGEKTVGSNSVILTREELDVPTSHQYQSDRNDIFSLNVLA